MQPSKHLSMENRRAPAAAPPDTHRIAN